MPGRGLGATPVVTALLLANGLAFLWQVSVGAGPILRFALWPLVEQLGLAGVPTFHLWQLLSYGFLHGGLLHLFANMFALWMFGVQIELLWGSRPFAVYYFTCLVGAGLIQLAVATLAATEGAIYPTIGASGAVFGILLAFGMMFPNQQVMLLFPPIPMKAKWFVILYGAFELWAGVTGTLAGVAHFAHLGGMAFGYLLIQYWRGKLPIKPKRRLRM